MKGYVADIEASTEVNGDFRWVLHTEQHLQFVLMAVGPGQDIGSESHATHDQVFRVERGCGEFITDGETHEVRAGAGIVVPAGAVHNLRNTGDALMRLYTLYGPPNRVDQHVQATKAEALASHEAFEGATTE